jgi:hypothetical protein
MVNTDQSGESIHIHGMVSVISYVMKSTYSSQRRCSACQKVVVVNIRSQQMGMLRGGLAKHIYIIW